MVWGPHTATSPVLGHAGTEMAAGLHWFLKYACCSAFSWAATGGRSLDHGCLAPDALRQLEEQGPMHRERSVTWHYYQNVVTPRSAPKKSARSSIADAFCACGIECCDTCALILKSTAFIWPAPTHQDCTWHNRW